ncbi:hypothetical protein M0R04_04585 [Candidatus Dojkabacteria bacterium]|jgi:hypothetical protein|nr:hypothetical protein [Candidatus Dojkabacteria bacterium]
MSWILIIIFGVGIGGYGRGLAVNSQEFDSREKCEYTKQIIINEYNTFGSRLVNNNNLQMISCVEK